jgi:hypothetical protein
MVGLEEETKDEKEKIDYFWKTEECINFIKLMHKYGKSWVNISKHLD